VVERFRGSDAELVQQWQAAVEEVKAFLESRGLMASEPTP